MIRGIHHVAVHVRDLDRMIEFYRDAFGFEVVGEEFSWRDTPWLDQLLDVPGSAARGAMLRAGSCYMELFEFSAPATGFDAAAAAVRQGLHPFLCRRDRHRAGVRALEDSGDDLRQLPIRWTPAT